MVRWHTSHTTVVPIQRQQFVPTFVNNEYIQPTKGTKKGQLNEKKPWLDVLPNRQVDVQGAQGNVVNFRYGMHVGQPQMQHLQPQVTCDVKRRTTPHGALCW